VHVVLIDPSVYGALGVDEGDHGDGHSFEGNETRGDMIVRECSSDRMGGHSGIPFIRTIRGRLPSADDFPPDHRDGLTRTARRLSERLNETYCKAFVMCCKATHKEAQRLL